MAKAAAQTREPVTARGLALLALIAAAPGGVLMLTQEEGSEAVAAGHAVVDGTKVEGNTAAVSLTEAGKAALTAEGSTATGAAAANGFEIDTDVAPPVAGTRKRKAREGGYPFDALPVGGSFHVPKPADKTVDELLARLSSSVSGARSRYSVPVEGETEEVKTRTYKRTEDGKGFVKDEAGKRIVENETTETRTKMEPTREFKAFIVDATDKRGEGVRVIRQK